MKYHWWNISLARYTRAGLAIESKFVRTSQPHITKNDMSNPSKFPIISVSYLGHMAEEVFNGTNCAVTNIVNPQYEMMGSPLIDDL